jgi:hypothetical protein
MLIDFTNPQSVSAWLHQAPERHAPQLVGLGDLELHAAFRWPIFRALRSLNPGCPWPWTGPRASSGRRRA